MSVKFRCLYCRRLLGISDARVGTLVDCPGCGRSLRVPSPSAADVPLADAPLISQTPLHVNDDHETLQSALSELSQLDDADDSIPQLICDPTSPTQSAAATSSQQTTDLAAFDEGRIVPHRGVSVVSASWFKAFPVRLFVAALMVITAFVSGILLGRFTNPGLPDRGDVVTDNSDAASSVRAVGSGHHRAAERSGSVSGQVTVVRLSGETSADAGATVLLLPKIHPGRLTLDGRSLRELQDSADRSAVQAALAELGASVTWTNDEGKFQLIRHSRQQMQLVVVSRMVARAPDRELSPAVKTLLQTWFVSTAHVVGRLETSQQLIEALPIATQSTADGTGSTDPTVAVGESVVVNVRITEQK